MKQKITRFYCMNDEKKTWAIQRINHYHISYSVEYPDITPNLVQIITHDSDDLLLNQLLSDVEHVSDIYIFYDISDDKCTKNIFKINAKHNTDKIANNNGYITGVPDIILPSTMRKYYNFPVVQPTDVNRPNIAVISLGGYYSAKDLSNYWEKCGLTNIKPTITDHLVSGTGSLPPFDSNDASVENTLDIELIGGFCPSANIHFYSATNSDSGYLQAFQQSINDKMDIISTSWGANEEQFYGLSSQLIPIFNTLFKRAVTGKISSSNESVSVSTHYSIICAATGDYGSSDHNYNEYNVGTNNKVPIPHIDFPASSPWVIACGGTSLYLDTDIDPSIADQESAWYFGGGGESSFFPRPDFQQLYAPWNNSWPASPICYKINGSPYPRTIPDVVFNADPNSPWTIIFAGYESEGAGTSACAPIMASLLGEFYVASKPNASPRQGYFGNGFLPSLYNSPSACIKRVRYGNNITVNRNPITTAPNPYGLYDGFSNTYYAIWSQDTKYTMCSGVGVVNGQQLIQYLNTIVCVAKGTLILMENHQQLPIEQIKRGDRVIGYKQQIFRVADVNKQLIPERSLIDIMEFRKNSIGVNIPSETLFITPNHPIFYGKFRKPAKTFTYLSNIVGHIQINPEHIIQPEISPDDKPIYYLYDLQFDDDGSYIANNTLIQSRSPWSDITPLKKELYYDISKYSEELCWDCKNQPLPLNENILIP